MHPATMLAILVVAAVVASSNAFLVLQTNQAPAPGKPARLTPEQRVALEREFGDGVAGLNEHDPAYLELLQQSVRVTSEGADLAHYFDEEPTSLLQGSVDVASGSTRSTAAEVDLAQPPAAVAVAASMWRAPEADVRGERQDGAAQQTPTSSWADASAFEKELEAVVPPSDLRGSGAEMTAGLQGPIGSLAGTLSARSVELAQAQEAAERQVVEAGRALTRAQEEAALEVRHFQEAAKRVQEAWAHVQTANEWAASAAAAKARAAGQVSSALLEQPNNMLLQSRRARQDPTTTAAPAGGGSPVPAAGDPSLAPAAQWQPAPAPASPAPATPVPPPPPPPAPPAPAPPAPAPPAPAPPAPAPPAPAPDPDGAGAVHKRCGHAGQVPCTEFLRYFTFFYTTSIWRALIDWLGIFFLMLAQFYNCFQRRFCACGLCTMGIALIVFGVLRPQHS